jgi:hypothetical protein
MKFMNALRAFALWRQDVALENLRAAGADRGRPVHTVAYIADGKETDGNPSLRYITLLREGARAHGLPEHYLRFLDSVKHAE